MAPGDRLLLYTDGLTEAFNPREEEYGEERVASFLRRSHKLGNDDLLAALRNDVLAFCETARPRDDMTLMVIAREG